MIELLAFDLFGALIGGAERKLAGHAFAQRPVVAIEHAHGNHGPCTPVCHKVRQLGYQFDFRGSGGEEDLALDRLVDFAEAVYDVCAQHRAFVLQRNAAPLAHSVFAGLCLAGAFEVEAAYRLAVDTKRDFLSLAVPDCDANSRGTWIVTDFRGQPAVGAVAQGDPVGRRAVCFRHGVAFALRVRFALVCLDDRLDTRREGVFRQARMEICDDKRSALSNDEARRCAARVARVAMTIHELAALGQRHAGSLDHVRARHDPFEVIAALAVGHCKAAVFEHDTYARNAAPRVDERTIACSHAPDDGHPAGNCLAFDFDAGAGNDFPPERVDRHSAIFGIARRRIGAHGHGVGYAARSTAGDVAEFDPQLAPICRELGCVLDTLAVDPHGIAAEPQPA